MSIDPIGVWMFAFDPEPFWATPMLVVFQVRWCMVDDGWRIAKCATNMYG